MTQPLRVLHVIERMDRGGAETMLMNLYRAIDRNAIQFDFMVHTTDKAQYDDEIASLGGRIFRIHMFLGYNPATYWAAWRKFFTAHPEHGIVHGHITSSAAVYLRVAHRFGRTTIAHSHSEDNGPGLLGLGLDIAQKFIPRTTDYFFACSDQAAVDKFGSGVLSKPNYRFFPNGIDTNRYVFDPEARERVREEFGFGDAPVVGHVGRFVLEKNHEFLIEVFASLLGINPQARLLLVGDGVLRPKVEKKVKDLGLGDSVTFARVRSDIPELLCGMDVFCFPSIHEGLPVSVVEAEASGLPVVLPDTLSPQLTITDRVTRLGLGEGALVWAGRLNELLAATGIRDERTAHQVGEAGFDVRETAAWLTDFYASVWPSPHQ